MKWKRSLRRRARVRDARHGRPAACASRSNVDALTGTVKDGTGAVLPGVTVNVSSPSAGRRRADQRHRLAGQSTASRRCIPASTSWKPRCPASRPSSAATSCCRSARRRPSTSTLSVASVSETVQVTGETPVVDIKSSASNTQLTDALLQNLPTGRFQPDIINLTPGVNSQRRVRRLAELQRAADGRRRRQRPGRRHALVVLQLQLGRADAGRRARRQRRVRRVHRRRRQQHHPLRQQQVHGLVEYLTERKNWVADNTTSLSADLRRRSRRARSTATGTRPARSAARS